MKRNPYVGEGADGARRSAQIDRDELDTLAADDPRRPRIEESIALWEAQARAIDVVVRPGSVPDWNGRRMDVYVEIKYDGHRLSITGVEGPNRNGNCRGGAGQITLTPDVFEFADGWSHEKVWKLAEVWSLWHLNDMRAGCEHQRALGWTYDEHPSEECPECGYRMGSAWLFEEVPADVLAFLAELPPTDKPYPWAA